MVLQPIPVGMGHAVRGRVDGSAELMRAAFDTHTRILHLTCSKVGWFIDVYVNAQGDIHVISMFGLSTPAMLVYNYDAQTGVLRADSGAEAAFWLEVDKSVWNNEERPAPAAAEHHPVVEAGRGRIRVSGIGRLLTTSACRIAPPRPPRPPLPKRAKSQRIVERDASVNACIPPEQFLGDADGPAIVVLGAHYVTMDSDAYDSDSRRLDTIPLCTGFSRFVGVSYGVADPVPGFQKASFKPGIPASDAEAIVLDYFWLQKGGNWIEDRYGNNWHLKIEAAFSASPTLRVFIVPLANELFRDCADPLRLKFACTMQTRSVGLSVDALTLDASETLHPLVVATRARDDPESEFAYGHNRWEDEGRVDALQRVRYAPNGFLVVHRFDDYNKLADYLHTMCHV